MRVISLYASIPFVWLRLSANAVTIIGFLIGIVAACFLVLGGGWLLPGGILILVTNLFDFIDGNLARYYKSSSYFGKFLDSFTGILIFPLFIFSLGLGVALHVTDHWNVVVLTAGTVCFVLLDLLIEARFIDIKMRIPRETDVKQQIASSLLAGGTPAKGFRAIPRRYANFHDEIIHPLWLVFLAIDRPHDLLFVNFLLGGLLFSLTAARCLLKAYSELMVEKRTA